MSNWVVPVGKDVNKVISLTVAKDVNENTTDEATPGDEVDLELPNRRDELVAMAVTEVRGAIRSAGRFAYAVTANSVPPEGERYTLMLAAFPLVLSTPSLAKAFMSGDGGTKTTFERMYDEACAWVKGLNEGNSFTEPTDPVGEDWTTAVTASNKAINGVSWADNVANDTEYAAGETADGDVVSTTRNNMNTA